jgi:poly-beta-hydroxyalkanoate depolymerase
MEAIKKYYDNEFEVHSIGINTKKLPLSKKYFYHRIDLSLINFELINELTKIPYPDIITASPPCES